VKPNSSARCANIHDSLDVAIPIPKSINVLRLLAGDELNSWRDFRI
jgi:hypothetical protein